MNNFTIRPVERTLAAYAPVAALSNEIWPDNKYSAEELLHEDNELAEDAAVFGRWVVAQGDELVATLKLVEVTWQAVEGKYWVEIEPLAKVESDGIFDVGYDFLMAELAPHNPRALMAYTREDKLNAKAFWSSCGFALGQKENRSLLDLSAFDPTPFLGAVTKSAENEIEIVPLTALQQRDPNWLENSHALYSQVIKDVPSTEAQKPRSLASFSKKFGGPSFSAELWFTALHGDQYVGYSYLELSESEPEKLYTGITGVVRGYRRKGVATTLKLAGFKAAQARGITEIETDNEEHNPMYQLNMALGFVPAPAWLAYEKQSITD